MDEAPSDRLRMAIRRQQSLRLLLIVLGLLTLAWGGWCWLLVMEYVTDYGGETRSVGLFSVIVSMSVWGALSFATMATWRSIVEKPNRTKPERTTPDWTRPDRTT
ncbi:MAG: hypothetical protein ACRDZ3_02525 [Acidimicrobiia bacterium]